MPASLPTTAARDPFLLPICSCGGPMNLASLEPHPTQSNVELKTYKCLHCGRLQELTAPKRSPAVPR